MIAWNEGCACAFISSKFMYGVLHVVPASKLENTSSLKYVRAFVRARGAKFKFSTCTCTNTVGMQPL